MTNTGNTLQEQKLRELQAEWAQEYEVRRQMLIERAKVCTSGLPAPQYQHRVADMPVSKKASTELAALFDAHCNLHLLTQEQGEQPKLCVRARMSLNPPLPSNLCAFGYVCAEPVHAICGALSAGRARSDHTVPLPAAPGCSDALS